MVDDLGKAIHRFYLRRSPHQLLMLVYVKAIASACVMLAVLGSLKCNLKRVTLQLPGCQILSMP